ncbi:MAG: helix-hairpin-helix domain-containing protein [Bacteroidales bacterium]|nr:helix-hairpin-helix domain-containing protein [Bacteroidales bacterium]
MKIPEEIKDFFYFTKSERNGIFFLIILIFLIIILPKVYFAYHTETKTDAEKFAKEIISFENSLQSVKEQTYQDRLDRYISERYDTLELFYFNPNSTTDKSFKKLGLTDKQIATIRNYLNKGGKFYIKDDFRKIYGIRQSQYLRLKPYLLLADEIPKNNKTKQTKQNTFTDSLFSFDPNTLSAENLKKLGLSDKQINIIENFRNKGGIFYKPEDFKKIYGISNETYDKLSPYIKIEENQIKTIKTKTFLLVDINSATHEELTKIKGIGDYLANNIIWYRKKLGGYVKKEQLLEIKNFRKSTFEQIKTNIIIDATKIKKININFSEVKDLVKHPYLNYNQAKAIVDYRIKNGAYQSVNILIEKKILPVDTFNKIKEYLSI